MPANLTSRKGKPQPHIHAAKLEIISIIDFHIAEKVGELHLAEDGKDARRKLAIFIQQRNRICRNAGVAEMPLSDKDGTGQLTFKEEDYYVFKATQGGTADDAGAHGEDGKLG